jgi:hypothetical protein
MRQLYIRFGPKPDDPHRGSGSAGKSRVTALLKSASTNPRYHDFEFRQRKYQSKALEDRIEEEVITEVPGQNQQKVGDDASTFISSPMGIQVPEWCGTCEYID